MCATQEPSVSVIARHIIGELRCYDSRSYDELRRWMIDQVPGVTNFNVGTLICKAIDALQAMGFVNRVYDNELCEQFIEIDWDTFLEFKNEINN
jgi:hypothetical protein